MHPIPMGYPTFFPPTDPVFAALEPPAISNHIPTVSGTA